MANLNTLSNNDEYYTNIETWNNILKHIPRDQIILEPFYGDGTGPNNLKSLGLNVISEDIDFNEAMDNFNYDIVLTNPPFSTNILKSFLKKLHFIDKPFVIILPISKITAKYFQDFFKNKIQIIIPSKRIKFIGGNNKNNPSFASIFVCYKMKLENDIIFL